MAPKKNRPKAKAPSSNATRTVTRQVTTVTTTVVASKRTKSVPGPAKSIKKPKPKAALPRVTVKAPKLPPPVPQGAWLVTRETSGICETVGTYPDQGTAVGIAKRQLGNVCGLPFASVAKSRYLRILTDSSDGWDVLWTPPNGLQSRVCARPTTSAAKTRKPKKEKSEKLPASRKKTPVKKPEAAPTTVRRVKQTARRTGIPVGAVHMPPSIATTSTQSKKVKQTARKPSATQQTARKSSTADTSPGLLELLESLGNTEPGPAAPMKRVARKTEAVTAGGVKRTARRTGSIPGPSSGRRTVANGSIPAGTMWVVTKQQGYYPNSFHTPMLPRNETVGVFQDLVTAVSRAKKEVGKDVGWQWDEVVEGGDLTFVRDDAEGWEVCWSPPDSEYCKVKVEGAGVTGGTGHKTGAKKELVEESSDGDEFMYMF